MRNFKYCQTSEWLEELSTDDFLYIINFEYISNYENPLYDDPKYRKLIYLLPESISKFIVEKNGLMELRNFIFRKIYKFKKFKNLIKDYNFSKKYIKLKIEKFLNFIYEDIKNI